MLRCIPKKGEGFSNVYEFMFLSVIAVVIGYFWHK